MLLFQSTGYFFFALLGLALFSPEASGVILYRVGTPFTAAEKDSLQNLGIDFRSCLKTLFFLFDPFIESCKYKGMFYSLSCAYLKKPRIRSLS